ncbi:GntR family transcriptional regulator [Microbaculum marinisediminis]|uniref:GntR family transcriptional regulator n=1 Tax=Microbaculum marinisediminis TaxID=2931392 RepID=A0AAW5QYB7_9HYPH|nr:GntR family transcriptional regulator [Microbaculum sp. A6E488]MCT8971416.1 GntR family transcriptional regulator [Microbaculum sp. A6E488]
MARAYAELERRIVSLQFRPGQVVSENSLTQELSLGRTPIREALRELSREGLVTIMPKRGVVIAEIDIARQLRLLELRRVVERLVVECAAQRATDLEKRRFANLTTEMRRAAIAEDGEAFLDLDRQFDEMIVEAARNEFAAATMRLNQGLSRRFWFAYYRHYDNLSETIRLHAEIAQAISQGDAAEAAVRLDRLIDNVEAFTRATLDFDRSWLTS